MKITAIVEVSLSGSHTVKDHPICGERHGHAWRVRVEIAADEKDLDTGTVAEIITQYHLRDFDRFLPGVETHCSGLGAFFRERLSDYPVTAIEVTADAAFGVRLEWERR